MTKDNLKIQQFKELLEIIKHKVDMLGVSQRGQSASVSLMRDQQSVMNKKLDELQESVDANTAAVMELESTVNGYGDMYKINDSNIRKMEKRLKPLEEDAGIEIPPELQMGNFA